VLTCRELSPCSLLSSQAGRVLFGFGGESLSVGCSTIIADWFMGRELGACYFVSWVQPCVSAQCLTVCVLLWCVVVCVVLRGAEQRSHWV